MSYIWQRWMADEFRAAGLDVREVEGWRDRGRPASTGHYDPSEGVTNHHTGFGTSATNPNPALQTLIVGRPDLPGPLAPWSVDFNGVVWIIAAGRCNHAGRVGKSVPFAFIGADGNAIFMGDEIDTNGLQKLSPAQRHAVAVTNAVYLKHFDRPVVRVHRHEDISGTGKWDLGSLTTAQLRDDAAEVLPTIGDDMPLNDADKQWIEAAIERAVGKQLDRIQALVDTARRGSYKRDKEILEHIEGEQ